MFINLAKKTWTAFTENFGSTIMHPQSLLLRFQKEAISEAKKHVNGRLVDIGCGRMPYRKEFEPLVEEYIGVDHPEVSKLYPSQIKPGVLADAKKLPFKSETFDTALLFQVLEHVDLPQEVITEAARILKHNGVLIISVPFLYPLHDMPHDWGRYTSSALKGFVENAGLKVITLRPQGAFFEFWLQMFNTFFIKLIYDMIKSGINLQTIILLPVVSVITLPMMLINNVLILLINFIKPLNASYPNYFPLQYIVVARKTRKQ